MENAHDPQGDSLLDSTGPILVWIFVAVVMVIALGLMGASVRQLALQPPPVSIAHAEALR